jgi:hypothetical protein
MSLPSRPAAARHEDGADMRQGTRGVFLFFLMLFLHSEAVAGKVARIIAAVNNDVITSIDLDQAVRLNAFLSGGSSDENRMMAETRDGLITRILLLQEARRLKFVEVTGAEIHAEVEAFKNGLGDNGLNDFLEKNRMTIQDLERMLAEQLLVKRFIEKKIALFIRISREEAELHFETHPEKFRGRRFLDAQKEITALLWEGQLDSRLEQYLMELRSKADIRINPLSFH